MVAVAASAVGGGRMAQQRVLVTAGAGGIGRAITAAFHRLGARVHVCDVDAAALGRVSRELAGVTHSCADVAEPEQVGASPLL